MPIMFIEQASPTTIELYSGTSRNPSELVLKAELSDLSLEGKKWKVTQCRGAVKDEPFDMDNGRIRIDIS